MTKLIECRHLSCAYDSTVVVKDVDLVVKTGEFVGVVGPSGSGKTTLLKVILKAIPPTHGHVDHAPGVRLSYVPQVETVDWNFPVTVTEVVVMTQSRRKLWPRITTKEREDTELVLERLGLAGLGSRHIRELSGGQQQRVFIARALFHQPDLLVLDEPTSGVDVRTRHEMMHLLAELNEGGMSILLTTHDLNGLAAHLPRLVCLNTSVIADGSPSEVLTPEVLEKTYGAPMEVLSHGGMPVVLEHGAAEASRRLSRLNAS